MSINNIPHNLAAEKYFIWSMLSYPYLLHDYITTPTTAFYSAVNAKIRWHIKDQYHTGKEATFESVNVILNEDVHDHVYDMFVTSYSIQDIPLFYKEVMVTSYKREVYLKLSVLHDAVVSGDTWIADVKSILWSMDEWSPMVIKTTTILEEVSDIVDNRERRDNAKITTWYTKLDILFNGWLTQWQLVCIGARPWMGKTSMMLNMASQQADKWFSVWFISYEMSNMDIAQRYMSIKTSIAYSLIDRRDNTILDKIVQLDNNNITLLPPTKNIDMLCDNIIMQKAKHWLDVLYIDYLQLMVSYSKSYNRDQSIGLITNSLKALALDHKIVIVIWSQLNREADRWMSQRPKISNLRESGNVEQDSDIVMLLYRDRYYDREDGEDGIEVDVAKHRNWPVWVAKLGFKESTMTLYNIPLPQWS